MKKRKQASKQKSTQNRDEGRKRRRELELVTGHPIPKKRVTDFRTQTKNHLLKLIIINQNKQARTSNLMYIYV